MNLWGRSKRYLLLASDDEHNWHSRTVRLRPGGKVPTYVKIEDDRFRFEPEHAFRLRGGDPTREEGFWSAFIDWIDRRPKWIIYYRAPGEAPVDLTPSVQLNMEINPRLERVLTRSKLLDEYLRSLRYDKGVSLTMVFLILIGVGALLFLMYSGGYFK